MIVASRVSSLSIRNDAPTLAPASQRWVYHRSVLASQGISSLSTLGKLQLSGPVVPQGGGISIPSAAPFGGVTTIQSVLQVTRTDTQVAELIQTGGQARLLRTIDSVARMSAAGVAAAPSAGTTININHAYWAAQSIELADNTTVVLKAPQQFLVIICERLSVGANVVFTWEPAQVPLPQPAKLNRPFPPMQVPATPAGIDGVQGLPGVNGLPGAAGFNGSDAPAIELWVLELAGSPIFYLRGQDGGAGGAGQDGGQGGVGSLGRPESYDFFGFCAKGAGSGGDGGPGGRGGNGGAGGNGGHGGKLLVQAPQDMLEQFGRRFYVSVDGGRGGVGGSHGNPGAGGVGGRQGARPRNCAQSTPRHDGAPGPQGLPGLDGPLGRDGATYGSDAISFIAISRDDFQRELTEPAIVSVTPANAHVGDHAVIDGLRFSSDDTLLIDGNSVTAKIVADTTIVLDVPRLDGGHHRIQVRQSDGTLSNTASLYVLPAITAVSPGRIRPGSTATVVGSGFSPDARISLNRQYMTDVTYVDSGTMTFRAVRPANVTPCPGGEAATLEVTLGDASVSNAIDVVVDTLRMVVMGDSVAWGQGLQENEKYHEIVERALAAQSGNIGVYKTVLAHSGATIGVGDSVSLPAIDGEVPTSYPTILQQCAQPIDAPDTVDIVLLNGGLNDVNFRYVLNPTISPSDLVASIDRHCRLDMIELLRAVTQTFSTATIVVSGYFPIVTKDSDVGLLEPLLIATGVWLLGIPGGMAASQAMPLVIRNCQIFYEQSSAALGAAVDQINEELETPRVVFANPDFTSAHAALSSDPWLFGVNPDLTIQDLVVGASRAPACVLNADRTSVETCKRASAGHPNVVGAQQYASVILDALSRGAGATRFSNLPDAPAGFLWGAATAGYQVEGGIENNDWHVFTTSPAIQRRVAKLTAAATQSAVQLAPPGNAVGHGDIGVLSEDLDRAKALGLNAYRFSIEWSRVQPQRPAQAAVSAGDFDAAALSYYDRVVDECVKRGLEPIVTLNHMTLPSWVLTPPRESSVLSAVGLPTAVEDAPFTSSLRGWESEDTIQSFVQYVQFVVTRFSGRVKWWLTLNEPVGSVTGIGYLAGLWSPGFNLDGDRAKRVYFNLIKAHARAYDAIKAIDPAARVGFAHAMMHAKTAVTAPLVPLDVEADATKQFDYFYNWHFLEAVIRGQVDVNISHAASGQKMLAGDELSSFFGFEVSSARPWHPRLDFVGINYYRAVYVFFDTFVAATAGFTGGRFENHLETTSEPHGLVNSLGWEISPEGLGTLVRNVHARYSLPILITENGLPEPSDELRAPFIVAHIEQLLAAMADGVDVRGYIHWSLLDNFEWHEGYRPESHFGLFGVDRGDSTLPRRMNEGALALLSIASDNNVGRQSDAFGTITPKGDRVRPPRRSAGAVFAGTVDGAPIVCLFERRKSRDISGLVSMAAGKELHRLTDVSWDQPTATLKFRHSTKDGVVRAYRCAVNNGSLTGSYEQSGTSGAVEMKRLMPCGTWSASSWWRRLKISQLGPELAAWGERIGEQPKRWQRLDLVAWDGTTLTVDDGVARFTGTVAHDLMSGVLSNRTTGSADAWTASRQEDDLPF